MNDFQNRTIKESVTELVDHGHQTVDTIKSRVSEVRAQVRETSVSLRGQIMDYVSTSPLKAVGLAFGLGYIAMRIRTSPVMELAFLGAFGYGVNKVLGRRAPAVP